MAKFFKKILCPVDFDDNSMAALHYARDLAKEHDATLYVLHVVFVPVASPGFPLEPYPVVSDEPGKLELEKIAKKYLDGKVRYELACRTGKPAETISQAAEDFNVDLIVMATHGRKGVTHLLLGSVAEHVVRASNRPVLTIRPKDASA
ncbi:MAG: universal stress protein [Candidatus Binataceae bacterium]